MDVVADMDSTPQSEELYRSLFDAIDDGFCIIEVIFDEADKAMDYRFLEVNAAFERQTGLADAKGKTMRSLAPQHEEFWFEVYGQVAKTQQRRRFEYPATQLGHYYEVSAFPVGGPAEHRVGVFFRDILLRKQAEAALRIREAGFKSLAELSPDGIVVNCDNRVVYANAAAHRIFRTRVVGDLIGRAPEDITPPEQHAIIAVRMQRCLEGGSAPPLEIELICPDQSRVTVEASAGPIVWNGVPAVQILWRDVTERHAHARQRELLIHELNHRVKNILAVVQGVARQTFGPGMSAPGVFSAFEGRLLALAGAHDLLAQQSWEAADLQNIVAGALRALKTNKRRIGFNGPPVQLGAKQAVAVAMALHELQTNALKYGALSNSSGTVTIAWTLSTGPSPRVHLVWREEGGPAVTPPKERGFGTKLIAKALPLELGGEVHVMFEPLGLVCSIDAPVYLASKKQE